jgi:hypothetical protein
MYNVRINISDHPKIMIKSPEVCFGITRQHAQVCNFMNFLRFSTHFTSFCKLQTLLKIHFALKSLGRFRLLQIGPWFALNSLQRTRALQLGPWPWEEAGSPEIQRLRRRSRPWNGSGSLASSPRTWGWSELGRRARRHGGSMAAGDGCRGGSGSGEEGTRGGQCMTLGGYTGPRGEGGIVDRRRGLAAQQVHRRRWQWRAAAVWSAEGEEWRRLSSLGSAWW